MGREVSLSEVDVMESLISFCWYSSIHSVVCSSDDSKSGAPAWLGLVGMDTVKVEP